MPDQDTQSDTNQVEQEGAQKESINEDNNSKVSQIAGILTSKKIKTNSQLETADTGSNSQDQKQSSPLGSPKIRSDMPKQVQEETTSSNTGAEEPTEVPEMKPIQQNTVDQDKQETSAIPEATLSSEGTLGEQTKGESKKAYIIGSIILGLIIIGGVLAYYFLIFAKVPQKEDITPPMPAKPVQTTEVVPPEKTNLPSDANDTNLNLEKDEFVQKVESLSTTTDLNGIQKGLDELDFNGIDTELQTDQF